MEEYLIPHHGSILLVGEGNFSFALGLTKYVEPTSITATCFETDVELESRVLNISLLKEKGARVIFGVDGTKLHEHSELGSQTFSRIVFNFPHVGGKMKINLNRKLLQKFISSSVLVLAPGGRIIVSLCRGQGGTSADKPVRRWDDSWKIVESAAESCLVLECVVLFPKEMFPDYVCVGYKGLEKGFHNDGALVHVLRESTDLFPCVTDELLLKHIEKGVIQTDLASIQCSGIHAKMYNRNLLQDGSSAVHYIYKCVVSFVEKLDMDVLHLSDEDIPLYVKQNDVDILPGMSCVLLGSEERCSLRSSLVDVMSCILEIWGKNNSKLITFPGAVFSPLGDDFTSQPVTNELMVLGSDVTSTCTECITEIVNMFNQDATLQVHKYNSALELPSNDCSISTDSYLCSGILFDVDSDTCVEIAKMQTFKFRDKQLELCLINIDNVAKIIFKLDNWRQLWTLDSYIKYSVPPVFIPASLYPVLYSFDICFWEGPNFEESKFFEVLWLVAGYIIVQVSLLNTYTLPDDGRKTRCYRLLYQSFEKPLSRKKTLAIHQNVIGQVLYLTLSTVVK